MTISFLIVSNWVKGKIVFLFMTNICFYVIRLSYLIWLVTILLYIDNVDCYNICYSSIQHIIHPIYFLNVNNILFLFILLRLPYTVERFFFWFDFNRNELIVTNVIIYGLSVFLITTKSTRRMWPVNWEYSALLGTIIIRSSF